MSLNLPKRERALLEEILGRLSEAEPTHLAHTERWEHFYRLYHKRQQQHRY